MISMWRKRQKRPCWEHTNRDWCLASFSLTRYPVAKESAETEGSSYSRPSRRRGSSDFKGPHAVDTRNIKQEKGKLGTSSRRG